jgi:peptide/nickel transport system permease protein
VRKYLARRLLYIVLTYFLFLTMVYFLVDAQPGDFGNQFINNPRLTAEQRATLRAQLGLDRPAWQRFLVWVGNAMRGDFGISFSNYPRTVMSVILERAPRTILLFLSGVTAQFYVGFLLGKALAWRRGGFFEYAVTLGGVGLYTVFTPWLALMIIWVFAYSWDIFPIGKFIDPLLWRSAPYTANEVFHRMLLTGLVSSIAVFVLLYLTRKLDPQRRRAVRAVSVVVVLVAMVVYWLSFSEGMGRYAVDILHHLVLPIAFLILISFAGTMLLTRNSMLETLREDYILAARAKGLPEKVVRDKHAARSALLPVMTTFVLAMAAVLNGGVITETMFSWPGMGSTLLQAAQVEDIPMVLGALVFTGALTLVAHLAVDILYAYLDPRIRYS